LPGLEKGVKVRHTSRSWIVHVETLYGRSPAELGAMAKGLADRVARALMLEYGCRFGEGRFCSGYEIAIDDPVAQFLSRYFTVSTPNRKMDHSPGDLEGEIDHLSRDAAVEYLLMPERVKALEGKVEALHMNLTELISVLKQLFDLEEDPEKRQREQMGADTYRA